MCVYAKNLVCGWMGVAAYALHFMYMAMHLSLVYMCGVKCCAFAKSSHIMRKRAGITCGRNTRSSDTCSQRDVNFKICGKYQNLLRTWLYTTQSFLARKTPWNGSRDMCDPEQRDCDRRDSCDSNMSPRHWRMLGCLWMHMEDRSLDGFR